MDYSESEISTLWDFENNHVTTTSSLRSRRQNSCAHPVFKCHLNVSSLLSLSSDETWCWGGIVIAFLSQRTSCRCFWSCERAKTIWLHFLSTEGFRWWETSKNSFFIYVELTWQFSLTIFPGNHHPVFLKFTIPSFLSTIILQDWHSIAYKFGRILDDSLPCPSLFSHPFTFSSTFHPSPLC